MTGLRKFDSCMRGHNVSFCSLTMCVIFCTCLLAGALFPDIFGWNWASTCTSFTGRSRENVYIQAISLSQRGKDAFCNAVNNCNSTHLQSSAFFSREIIRLNETLQWPSHVIDKSYVSHTSDANGPVYNEDKYGCCILSFCSLTMCVNFCTCLLAGAHLPDILKK